MNILATLRVRPILVFALIAGMAAFSLALIYWRPSTSAILGWDAFSLFYIAFILKKAVSEPVEGIRKHAAQYDEGASIILLLSVIAAGVSVAAIVFEIVSASKQDRYGAFQICLAAATILLSWTFVHTIFAIHYAHSFYTKKNGECLEFPGEKNPNYMDFFYFSFVIGCACATADVNILSRRARTLAMMHGIIAFFFNTAVLALSINIAAGLASG